MRVQRELPDQESDELVALACDIADRELAPRVNDFEGSARFPREMFALLGRAGLLSLPMPVEHGGGGQSFVVYLQVLEELAARWVTIALGISVHTLSCHPVLAFGTDSQKEALSRVIVDGDRLGAYCLSEPQAGSDPAAIRATAEPTADGDWLANGTKAWITHGGQADFYTMFLRTSDGSSGLSCFHVPANAAGLTTGVPERKMGLQGSPTTMLHLDGVRLSGDAIVGRAGEGLRIALSALDDGRLGIAAIAVGLARAALDYALEYAASRETFGKAILDHQGVAFLLADMDAAVAAARATYLVAARRRDARQDYRREASIAKLIATDVAMDVTTQAVQVLGAAGYVRDHPVERYMREAKVMQIFEGTNQIQRLVISRQLARRVRHGEI